MTKKLTKQERKEIIKESAELLKGQGAGFLDFIRTQGVVSLAIGLAIGAAAGNTVKQIVEGLINPIVNFIVGSQDTLSAASWTIEWGNRTATFAWGSVLSSMMTLVATALVIYWLIRGLKLDRIDKKKV